jgi:hypothetical protein
MYCFCDTASHQYEHLYMCFLVHTFSIGCMEIDNWNLEGSIHVMFPIDQAQFLLRIIQTLSVRFQL